MKISRFRPALSGILLLGLMAAHPARADLLTSFSFTNPSTFLVSDGGIRSSTLTTTFPNDSIDNDANGANFNPNSPTRDNALELFSLDTSGASNQGKTLTLAISTANYRNLVVSFATQNLSGGFNNNAFQYSSDGTNFTTLRSYVPSTTGAFAAQTFDFSNITTLNNNASAAFRIVFNSSSTPTDSSANYLDNLTLNATAIAAVPEPSTWAMMILGVVALLLINARRRRDDVGATEPSPSLAL